jgi:hypothetical protein
MSLQKEQKKDICSYVRRKTDIDLNENCEL